MKKNNIEKAAPALKEIITHPQTSDMGSGWGYLEGAPGCTLEQILEFYHKNSRSWGTITIYGRNSDIVRKFDYDTYNNSEFYHHLSGWQYESMVKEVKFSYCFMSQDIDIYLEK